MTTIDKLDIGIYVQYAKRTQMKEDTYKEFRLQEAASIPPQTIVPSMYPLISEIDLLLGIVPMHAPWALFSPPSEIDLRRLSSFAFFRVVPSLGTLDEQEEIAAQLEKMECSTPEEAKEKGILLNCLKQIDQFNEWLGHIVGKMGEFLQA